MVSSERLRRTAAGTIRSNGARITFVRGAVEHKAFAFKHDYAPNEIDGDMVQRGDHRFLVSPVGLDIEPNNETDTIIDAEGNELLMPYPPRKLAPAGVVIYWEVQGRAK